MAKESNEIGGFPANHRDDATVASNKSDFMHWFSDVTERLDCYTICTVPRVFSASIHEFVPSSLSAHVSRGCHNFTRTYLWDMI